MVATVHTGTLLGIEAQHVEVEVDLVRCLPRVAVVGLAAESVRESTERVRSAILSSGLDFPKLRVTINLAPANLRKSGTSFDLPIAIAILAASGQIDAETLSKTFIAGELSLNGDLRPVPGALSMAMLSKAKGLERILLPKACAGEASVLPSPVAFGAQNLAEVVDFLRGHEGLKPAAPKVRGQAPRTLDLADVRGQASARRALEVAAAGGHSLLMVGPPGVGKTMLAARLPSILPKLTFEESLEVTQVHSVAGLLSSGAALVEERPFRAPHHSISAAGLLGNARLKPGELSLAHNGVLFLDELPEFSRNVIEQLRAPLEDRHVVLTRAAGTVRLPASVTLLAAANPCPCGYLGHPLRPCRCTPARQERYQARLSGPLADRLDMMVRVEPLESATLLSQRPSERSEKVRVRVEAARAAQTHRYASTPFRCNADATGPAIRELVALTAAGRRTLAQATETLALSGRAHDRILKVARTLADLEGASSVCVPHVAEAVAFRTQDQVDT